MYFVNNVLLKKQCFFGAACGFYVVFLLRQTNEKNKIMKKAIFIVVMLSILSICFASIATAAPITAAEIITTCVFLLIVLSFPVIAITIITNIEY